MVGRKARGHEGTKARRGRKKEKQPGLEHFRLNPLGELYPFTSHYLDIGGQRLHYVDEGHGPAVVMLHGNPTWSFYYRDLIKGLRDRYRVVAPKCEAVP